MATKEPLDEAVVGAIKAHRKAETRVAETLKDLKAALKLAVREDRITKKEADAIQRTFDKE